jgi:hypothetical protein
MPLFEYQCACAYALAAVTVAIYEFHWNCMSLHIDFVALEVKTLTTDLQQPSYLKRRVCADDTLLSVESPILVVAYGQNS